VANVAEEAVNTQRTVLLGFGSAILTLVILCVLTFTSSVGVAGWEAIVYTSDGEISNSPLPLALGKVVGENNWLFHLLITIGLFGLVASFHGIILAAGRATYEFGKMGMAPAFMGKVHQRFRTPANALLVNTGVGIVALFTGKTDEIITIAVFGALTLYVISMVSFFKLRKNEPDMERPFKTPFFPVFPALALIIAIFSIIAVTVYNPILFIVFVLLILVAYIYFTKVIKGMDNIPQ